jgi:hypothetical protein
MIIVFPTFWRFAMNSDTLSSCFSDHSFSLERTRFFPRQLITPDDLIQDQIYFREKNRRHNRLIHGWGIVCGAQVRPGKQECEVIIEPGYILGPYGDEIYIDREITVNLCQEGVDGNVLSPCGENLDPWCSNVQVDRPSGQSLYIAIRYAECQTRPVRVATMGCGCNELECEYSRIQDSYAIKVLTKLPSTYKNLSPAPSPDNILKCAGGQDDRPCPTCPSEPWVILANITLGADSKVTKANIDRFTHRRYVASFANFYFLCKPSLPVITAFSPENASTVSLPNGFQTITIRISFDRKMNEKQLQNPDVWLRIWQVFVSDSVVRRIKLTYVDVVDSPELREKSFTVQYQVETDSTQPCIIQIRSTDKNSNLITDTNIPSQTLDADFQGTNVSLANLDELWSFADEEFHSVNWGTSLESFSGKPLPSGNGDPGGVFHSWFKVVLQGEP